MIVPATVAHAEALDCRLPGTDAYWSLLGVTHAQGMRQTVLEAHEAWTWLTPEIGCIFGLTYPSLLEPPVFWIYPGPDARRKPVSFIKECLRLRPYFLEKYPLISGYCNIGFRQSERFLRFMGCELAPPQEYGELKLSRFYVGN